MQAFFDAFRQHITPGDILVLAVSGGVDSMVLLDLVLANHPRDNIVVAHFDHSLRGVESDNDRLFIANYCEKWYIHFEVEKMDINTLAQEEKMSIEMAARKYRYIFLEEIAQKYWAKYILTAHHLDDRIETAMFNLIRGTKFGGIHALSFLSSRRDPFQNHIWVENSQNCLKKWKRDLPTRGILTPSTSLRSDKTEKWGIFRPLLHISKSDILAYAKEKNIEYREDSTNTDTAYLRNHLRHTVLPEFERINPEYRRSIERFVEYSGEVQNWIDEQVREWLIIQAESIKQKASSRKPKKSNVQIGELNIQDQSPITNHQSLFSFLIPDFRGQSRFFQREIVRYLYEEANDGTIWLSEWLIEELIRFITEGSNSYGVREVKKLRLERRGERILWG